MAKHSKALVCTSCGASSPLPADLEALAFDCRYCGSHQLLPQHVVDQRRAMVKQRHQVEHQRRAEQRFGPGTSSGASTPSEFSSGSGVLVVVLVICIGLAVVIGGVAFAVLQVASDPTGPTEFAGRQADGDPPAAELAPPPPPPPPPLPEETDANNGLTAIRERMAALHEAGCDRVLQPPTRKANSVNVTATMTSSSHCVVLLGATSMPDTSLHLQATDPHGNAIETPAAGLAFEWRYCPTIDGEHRLVIDHEGRGPYHTAGYDCPKRRFASLGPIAAPFAEQ